MSNQPLQLEWLPGRFAVCQLEPDDPLPGWANAAKGSLVCITRTDQELSIVIDERLVPQDVKAERGFVAMRLVGVIDMASIGIFAKLTGALATANVPVFAISTYDTDYLLVREAFKERAIDALSKIARFG